MIQPFYFSTRDWIWRLQYFLLGTFVTNCFGFSMINFQVMSCVGPSHSFMKIVTVCSDFISRPRMFLLLMDIHRHCVIIYLSRHDIWYHERSIYLHMYAYVCIFTCRNFPMIKLRMHPLIVVCYVGVKICNQPYSCRIGSCTSKWISTARWWLHIIVLPHNASNNFYTVHRVSLMPQFQFEYPWWTCPHR